MDEMSAKRQAYVDAARQLGELRKKLQEARGLKKLPVISEINALMDKIAELDAQDPPDADAQYHH